MPTSCCSQTSRVCLQHAAGGRDSCIPGVCSNAARNRRYGLFLAGVVLLDLQTARPKGAVMVILEPCLLDLLHYVVRCESVGLLEYLGRG